MISSSIQLFIASMVGLCLGTFIAYTLRKPIFQWRNKITNEEVIKKYFLVSLSIAITIIIIYFLVKKPFSL